MAHMTNKKQIEREKNALNRAYNPFNTGTRTMKSKKDYDRKLNRVDVDKISA